MKSARVANEVQTGHSPTTHPVALAQSYLPAFVQIKGMFFGNAEEGESRAEANQG